jgi:parallel beta-helix repeat protein
MKNSLLIILLTYCQLMLFSCSESNHEVTVDASRLRRATNEETEKIIESFILAKDGDTISIGEGFFDLKTQLILDSKKYITIQGAGIASTVLSFKHLRSGGEGVKIVGNYVTIQDLTIEDAPGDGIKSQHSDHITFRRVNVTWTNKDKSQNGTYAIYPVQCSNVLIEDCIASHSKDAGIYVGQSEHIVVRNSLAFGNVAGIEIENSDDAEVYGNTVRNNSGGILVFNLPGLPKSDGRNTRIYNNHIHDNNHVNFATALSEEPNGNTVTMIPPGSGIILLAAKDVEIYGNQIHNNKTVNVALANYHITGFPMDAPDWSPFTSNVHLHDNEYKRSRKLPDFSKELGQLISVYNAHGKGKGQDIVYDGFWDKSAGGDLSQNPMGICIDEKQIEELRFTVFDLWAGPDHITSNSEFSPFVCNPSQLQTLKR